MMMPCSERKPKNVAILESERNEETEMSSEQTKKKINLKKKSIQTTAGQRGKNNIIVGYE